MAKDRHKSKKRLWSSTIFSLLGSTTAICCAGPGLAGCAVACASACGSVGLSIFGLSITGLAQWMSQYWYVFLILSILCFAEAFYRIFFVNKAKKQTSSKILFFASLALSFILFGRLLL